MPLSVRNRTLALGLVAGLLAGTVPSASAAPLVIDTDPAADTETAPQRPAPDPLTNDRLRAGVYPAQPVPPEFAVPAESADAAMPLDWSIGLRGTYTSSNGQGSFVTRLAPQFTVTHAGSIADIVVEGGAELARTSTHDMPVLSSAGLGISATAPLGPETTLSASGAIGLSQDLPGSPGLAASVLVPPQILTGGIDLGLDRQFGKFNLGIGAGAARTIYGPSTRSDTGLTDNSAQNHWSTEASLRLGYQITPIFEIFGEGALERDLFDSPNSAGLYPNATNRILRAGIAGNWNDVWSATVSAGIGERVFDAAALGAITAQLYGAEITYRPDPTIALTAGLETEMAPPGADAAGTARIEHTAFATAQYEVNSWLRLRASADWTHADLVGTGTSERQFGLGAGADYALGAHASLNADYGYGNRLNSSTGETQTHQVSLGITVSR